MKKFKKGGEKQKRQEIQVLRKNIFSKKNYSFFLPIIAKYSFHSIGNKFFF